jgi:FkbM family methyltransferase
VSLLRNSLSKPLRKTARAVLTRVPLRGMHRFARDVGPLLAPTGTEHVRIGDVAFLIDHASATHRYVYYGAYEQETVRHMRNALRPGDVCIDAGANIGYITAEMAASVGPTGKVYAFEPSQTCQRILASFLADAPNVEIVPAAVSEHTGTDTFFDTERIVTSGYGVLGSIAEPTDATTYDVKTWSIADFCSERRIEHVRYLKLDVEGSELAALRGARAMLKAGAVDIVHVEMSFADSDHARAGDEDVAHLLRDAGYSPYRARRRGDLTALTNASYLESGTRDTIWVYDSARS